MSRSDAPPNIDSIITSYQQTRKTSLALVAPLNKEDMQVQSMPNTSPSKWHLAHTSWAFETFLLKAYFKDYQAFDSSFEYLFNSYYNAIGQQFPRPQRGLLSRPTFEEVVKYRHYVDQHMDQLLNSKIMTKPSILKLVLLMINHEQQHQELIMTDIKHALSFNPLFPAYQSTPNPSYSESNMSWTQFDSGIYQIGHQSENFYFDNEGPQHKVYLEPFIFADRLVTNGEYIDFIEQGGYQNSSLWLSEAWYKIAESKTQAPLYWLKKGNTWFHYTFSGLVAVDKDAPVMHINYFEANAYANSVGKRLPTEQEWETAARSVNYRESKTENITLHSQGSLGGKLEQMFGQLWQWTSSSYNAYPGFNVSEGAVGEYNGKFMVNQYVLRGGSFVTPTGHIRPSYRNFFYPDASWQFSGIRLAESL